MPQNALAPPSVNTLNMAPYEAQFKVKDTGYKDRKYAGNVYSALLPALMRARFPEYVAFSPATVTTDIPREITNAGEFYPSRRTIALDPEGINAMLMEPYGKYGNIGFGDSNTTTNETLNALRVMLHESMHARMNLAPGQKRVGDHPAKRLKDQMSRDRFNQMMDDIRLSDLPSVRDQTDPYEIINEYFSTATPVRQMTEKNMSTRRIQRELDAVDRLGKKYPELEKMRRDWERPELFSRD
jgi:hypothetical protein